MIEEKKTEPCGVAARLARKNILDLSPYRCARDDYDSGVLLDANENGLGPTSVPTNAAGDPYDDGNHLVLERYPCPYQIPLKTAFAEYRGHGLLRPSQIFAGVGSDEAIDLLMRIFCDPAKDSVMITPPTYGMYKVCAKINDVAVKSVPLTPDFDLRVPEMLNAVDDTVKLMFVCSPGNPTAKSIPLADVEALAGGDGRYRGLVVVDEAYVDFSETESAVSLVDRYPNVVVLQTLSKAFGLAGIRMGFAVGSDDVIQLMNNVKAPYNVNKLTADVALDAFKNVKVLERNVRILLDQRDVLMKRLDELEYVVKVHPSDTNFVLFRLRKNAKEIYKTVADRGVVSRYRGSEMHCSECIRVTVGTAEENALFLKELDAAWNDHDS